MEGAWNIMGIEYKDSKRIVLDNSATFEDDDFAGWTVQSRASVTAGVLFTPDSNYGNAYITHSFKTYAIGDGLLINLFLIGIGNFLG